MGWSHRQIRPGRVLQAVADQLNNPIVPGLKQAEPPWFKVMRSVPPAESVVRTVAAHHNDEPAGLRRSRKPKKLYRPKTLHYIEDHLRTAFFKDHPWELARPRVMVELDGKDYQRCDWSKGLRQPGLPLSGECVVQRQLWLMENEKMDRAEAYDITRREFYRLRQQEEIERRVALEEARHVGAYFDLNRLDITMRLEDREYEGWKVWAGKQTERREARQSSQLDTFGLEDEEGLDSMEGPPDFDVEEGEREVGGVGAGAGAGPMGAAPPRGPAMAR